MTTTLSEIVDKALVHGMQKNRVSGEAATDVLNIASNVSNKVSHLTGINNGNSLSSYAQMANVEPRVIVEDTLRTLPNLDKYMLTLTNIYAAYYMLAIGLSNTVSGISVLSVLERFNPNRTASYIDVFSAISRESYMEQVYKLPNYKTADIDVLALDKPSKRVLEISNESDNNKKKIPNASLNQGLKQIADADNLAVGRLLEVTISNNGIEVNTPVSVRMRPMIVPQLIVRELMTFGDVKESWSERWHRWRAGELSLIGDVVLQNDLVRNRRKLLAMDKQGIYREMLQRRRGNRLAAIASGKASLGAISSFVIVSANTMNQIRTNTGMTLDNQDFLNGLFEQNSAMMFIVIDTDWENIRCYTHGVKGVAEYTFKQFEGLSKGNGPDIVEIMKAYTLNSNPRF